MATLASLPLVRSFAVPGGPVVDDANGAHPYVAAQETYDSNLYRLPSQYANVGSLLAPSASRSDYITTVYAGVDGRWALAQQSVGINLRVNDNRFARNKELNNYSGSADLLWNWHLGSTLSGTAGADYTRALASFGETLYLGRDLVDSTNYYASARYQLGPRWAMYGGIREADTSHSAQGAQINDSKTKSGKGGLEYATAVSNTIGLEYRYTRGLFPQGSYFLFNGPFDRDYTQDTVSILIKDVLSEKTLLNADVGYLKRDYIHEPIGAFSGEVGRVSLEWQATDKTQVTFAAWRELDAYLSSASDYFVAKGASISPVWVASEKLSFSLTLSTVDQDYISTSLSVLTLGSRRDKLTTEQASLVYQPIRALLINFSFSHQKRDSNLPQATYDEELANAAFTFRFE